MIKPISLRFLSFFRVKYDRIVLNLNFNVCTLRENPLNSIKLLHKVQEYIFFTSNVTINYIKNQFFLLISYLSLTFIIYFGYTVLVSPPLSSVIL